MLRFLLGAVLCAAPFAFAFQQPVKPKLLLVVVIDQFRGDYIRRYRAELTGGFDRLLKNGAWLSDAHFEQFPTITCVGHSQILTGALPSMTGIVGNEWWDYDRKALTPCVEDPAQTIVGAPKGKGQSPWRLQVSTVGDEMRSAGKAGKVIGVATKPRAAIMPSGHAANAAYWFDEASGNFVSSSYYLKELPAWVQSYNETRPMDKWRGGEWKAAGNGEVLNQFDGKTDAAYYTQAEQSPHNDEVVEALAELILTHEKLGQGPAIDLLSVSLSSTDSVGHRWGPDSPQAHENLLGLDRTIGRLLAFVDRTVGLKNAIVVLTADHGVAPTLEVSGKLRMPAGRFLFTEIEQKVEEGLSARYGPGPWMVCRVTEGSVYLDRDKARARNIPLAEMQGVAAAAVAGLPFVQEVFTAAELAAGRTRAGLAGQAVQKSYYPQRSGDLVIIAKPYWLTRATGTEHGSPFRYDTHVPVLFMGTAFKPGNYGQRTSVTDIAPTLAWLLDVLPPSGTSGRVLTEILAR